MTRCAVTFLFVFAVFCTAPALTFSHSYKHGDVAIGHIWAPPTKAGAANAPVYGPLLNRGSETAWLVGATTDIARDVRFRLEQDNGKEWAEAVVLRPNKPVALAPWRVHLWLVGLDKPLRKGDSFELTLDFAEKGTRTVTVVVEPAPGH